MSEQRRDAPAGDFDYEAHGGGYSLRRRPDPRIAARIEGALGDAGTVINVGAGSGSYEPRDREVTAVEPSRSMREQRPQELAAAIDATAEDLPFANGSFDAAMAIVTLHQWAGFIDAESERRGIERLERDLESGAWDERFGHLRRAPEYVGAVRLIVARR